MPVHRSCFLILSPTAACNIAAHDTFHVDSLRLFHYHHPFRKQSGIRQHIFNLFHIGMQHMVLHPAANLLKPKPGELVEHPSFLRNGRFQYVIERRYAVRDDDQHRIAQVVQLRTFPLCSKGAFTFPSAVASTRVSSLTRCSSLIQTEPAKDGVHMFQMPGRIKTVSDLIGSKL